MDLLGISSQVMLVLLSCGVYGVPPPPTWPDLYKSCVNVQTARETIRAGWYVDTANRRMRLDSYGIPQGLNESTALLFQDALRQTETFDYACQQFGPPLYIFLYFYGEGQMLSLFPSPEPPYRKCEISSIYNKFPNSPLLPDVEYVEEGHDNFTTYDHWRSEFFLFTMEYYFHTTNGLPYKLIANSEENLFLSFNVDKFDSDTFLPPHGVQCERST